MNSADLSKILEEHKVWITSMRESGSRANLLDADLRCANLCCANLLDADLRCADLRDANLLDADLRGADLRGANLRGAD
ncbi:pentapeptide repeat-containing protein, partial [Salmonella enterica]|nr:pentapeptide repeat-containing protein [Salmonella enterica]